MLTTTLALASLLPAQPAAPKFEIKDGDRIVWVGNTLVEREQRYGYWETALHAAFPDRTFTLRNLGWSGDTVHGEARGRFDFNNPDACFKQLVEQTLELKPTVILVSYGTNESFEGDAGLEKFEKGLNKLLDALAPAKARIVLFTPAPFENYLQRPNYTERNAALLAYSLAIQKIALRRGHILADLNFPLLVHYTAIERMIGTVATDKLPVQLTDNGIHFTDHGYRTALKSFLSALGQQADLLPVALNWKQLDPLRQAIIEKNELFFHRWRPQNETYLFGFRKHEQGKNAKEVAEFDPLVAKAEEKIEELRKKLLK